MSAAPSAARTARVRLPRLRSGMTSRWPVTVLVLLAGWLVAGQALSPWSPQTIDWTVSAPSAPALAHAHWLGTDVLGRDAYARVVAGARLSLGLALAAALVSVTLGCLVGIAAGFIGGGVDAVLMRTVDVCYALPQVFLILMLVGVLGRGPLAVLIGISCTGWLAAARVLRAESQLLREREFLAAARAIGMSPVRILWRHVVPNLRGPIGACLTIAVPQFVVLEGFMSFLGLGVQEPQASLGNLLAQATAHLERAPWLLAGPALVLVLTVLCLNTLADRIERARRGRGA